MTDLPDAESAIRTILREHTHKLGVCCRCGYGEGEQFAVSEHRHRAHVASVIAAVLAAASGPWAEQLDAELRADLEVQQKQNKELAAERDQALLRLKRIIELEPVAHAAEQIRESDGSFTTQVAGVRLEKCDEYGRTKTTAERDAALARNADLQKQVEFDMKIRLDVEKVLDLALGTEPVDGAGNGLAADVHLLAMRWTEALDRADALRAELDSLRKRVIALADEWEREGDGSEWIAALLWGSHQLRAIVRGSDDE